MNRSDILALYDAEMRADAPAEPGVRIERTSGIVCAVGRFNCILYSDLGRADADAAIAEQAAHFAALGSEVEWKVYGHDLPSDLGRRLGAAGFAADEPETLMVFDLAKELMAGPLPPDVEVKQIVDAQGLADLIAVNAAIWNHGSAARYEAYSQRLLDPTLALYVAYAGGGPVAAARLELPRSRSFAGLWGGCTLPAHRRRGIFRAIVAVRARDARARGFRYLNVDAAETSRPILERLGFAALTGVTGWKLKAAKR
ncbi:MAG TPA: GNAT family N-acetyltransferase [Candidatus Eremiobacteraceae bacterium]